MKRCSPEKLEKLYLEWLRNLEAKIKRVEKIEKDLEAESWQTVLSRRADISNDLEEAVFATLSKEAQTELSKKQKTIGACTDKKMKDQHGQLLLDLKDTQASVARTNKMLKVAETKTWKESAHDLLESMKSWWTKAEARPKSITEEVEVVRRLVAVQEERLREKQASISALRALIHSDCEHAFLQTRMQQAKKQSGAARDTITSDFREFAAALAELQEHIVASKAALHTQIENNKQELDMLHQLTEQYTAQIKALGEALAKSTVPVRQNQNSEQFISMVLQELAAAGVKSAPEPLPLERAVNKCKQGGAAAFETLIYQKAIAIMANPSWMMNLLLLHLPGTGKTCSIVLSLQATAQYYLHNPLADSTTVPAALVLVQNQASIPTYLTQVIRGCTDAKYMLGLTAVSHKKESENTHEWHFLSSATQKVVLKVVVHRMTVALGSVAEWNKGMKTAPPTGKHWELPKVGCVIVDEAHNMFNTTQMKTNSLNHAGTFLAQLYARPDLKKMLSTGTPVTDTDRFDDLARLLDFLRAPFPSGESICSDKASVLRHTAECDVSTVTKWFTQKTGGEGWTWKDGMQALFMTRVSGFVSYVTLEHDVGVYPRFTVNWSGKAYTGSVQASFINGGITVQDSGSSSTSDRKYMTIDVPSHKLNLTHEKQLKSENGPIGVHFNSYSDSKVYNTPPKWEAVLAFLKAEPSKKHFLFMPKKQYTALAKFVNWLIKKKEFEAFVLPWSRIPDSEEALVAAVDSFYKTFKPAQRYVLLDAEKSVEALLAIYNHPANSTGQYIRLVVGALGVKEGISLFSTHYVHLVEPPQTTTVFNQVIRRAVRYCSMKEIKDIKDWTVTVVIYRAIGSNREAALYKDIMNGSSDSPVEMAIEALKAAAIDCQIYSPLTKVKCRASGINSSKTSEYCVNPRDGSSKLITMQVANKELHTTEQACLLAGEIPGGLLQYDLHDENLFQLLTIEGYTPKAMTASNLIQRFGENASMVNTGLWSSEFQKPKLTFSRNVEPKVLMLWIQQNPRSVGDSVLFLLESKRKAADQTVVKQLQEKALLYTEAVIKDIEYNVTLCHKIEAVEKLMQADNNDDAAQLLSASLKVKSLGSKLAR